MRFLLAASAVALAPQCDVQLVAPFFQDVHLCRFHSSLELSVNWFSEVLVINLEMFVNFFCWRG